MSRTYRKNRRKGNIVNDGKVQFVYGGKWCNCQWCRFQSDSKLKKRRVLDKYHKQEMNAIYNN